MVQGSACDALKYLHVDMGENFPYLGSYDRKVRRHPRFSQVGLLYCIILEEGIKVSFSKMDMTCIKKLKKTLLSEIFSI